MSDKQNTPETTASGAIPATGPAPPQDQTPTTESRRGRAPIDILRSTEPEQQTRVDGM